MFTRKPKRRTHGFVDLTDYTTGRLTVIRYLGTKPSHGAMWECKCSCGASIALSSRAIKHGTKSCGCYRSEVISKLKRGLPYYYPSEYAIWGSMIARCHRKSSANYKDYGARGIVVCSRWRDSFDAFIGDMGPKPKGRWLERIKNDKGYGPDNCRWATPKEQQRNRRNNHLLVYKEQTRCISEWAEIVGLPDSVIRRRLGRGWSVEKALSMGVHQAIKQPCRNSNSRMITHNGQTLRSCEWAAITGVPAKLIRKRLNDGWSPEKALTTPVLHRCKNSAKN